MADKHLGWIAGSGSLGSLLGSPLAAWCKSGSLICVSVPQSAVICCFLIVVRSCCKSLFSHVLVPWLPKRLDVKQVATFAFGTL